MARSEGTFGRIEVYEHFMGFSSITMGTTALPQGGHGVMYVSVNEGSFAGTIDEPGGILAGTVDTASSDNFALYIGPFKPSDGEIWMETRLKVATLSDAAIYVGFSETLNASTPVMPAEFTTESFSYPGTGGQVGLQYDALATTPLWRAAASDAGIANIDCDSLACSAGVSPMSEAWDVVRVEIDPAGNGEVYLADVKGGLRLIKRFTTPVTASDLQFAIVMIENRQANAAVMEVDYFNAGGTRDWTR